MVAEVGVEEGVGEVEGVEAEVEVMVANGSGQGQASTQQPAAANRGGQHDQPQGATGGGYGQTRTPRQPFCFYCKNQG